MLLYSSIAEDDCPEWVPGATYAAQTSAAGQLSDYGNLAGATPFQSASSWITSNGVPAIINVSANGGSGELRTTARDTYKNDSFGPGSASFTVYPGEILHISCDVDSSGSSLYGVVGVIIWDEAGRVLGWLGAGYSSGQSYRRVTGSCTMPGSAALAAVWLQIDGEHGIQHPAVGFSRLYIGRTAETVHGPFAMRSSRHEIYQRLTDGISLLPPESDAANWALVSPVNRWAMFDANVNTRSIGDAGGLLIRLQPGMCNGVALLDMVGISDLTVTCSYLSSGLADSDTTHDYATGITLRTVVGGGWVRLIYTVQLEHRNVSDWKSFFVEPYETRTDVSIEFATRPDMTIEVAVASPHPQIGALIVGNFVEIGEVNLDPQVEIERYSSIQTNEFGVSRLTPRDSLKRATYTVTVPRSAIRRAFSTLAAVGDRPTVFVASDDYQLTPLTVFGICSRFTMALPLPTESIFNVEVTGISL